MQGKLESRLAQIEFEFQKNLARKFFEQSGTGCRTGLSMPTGKSKVCKHGKRIEECTECRPETQVKYTSLCVPVSTSDSDGLRAGARRTRKAKGGSKREHGACGVLCS